MRVRTLWRPAVGSAIVGIITLALTIGAPSPAQAYGDNEVRVEWVQVDTDSCVATSQNYNSRVRDTGNACQVPDEVDGASFTKDAGGVALKIVLRDSDNGQMLGKVEWHPYGEHLWVYDTRNDSDTFYFALYPDDDWAGVAIRPPGTSAVVDYRDQDLDYPEGVRMSIWVYDDRNLTDTIFAASCLPPQTGCYGGMA